MKDIVHIDEPFEELVSDIAAWGPAIKSGRSFMTAWAQHKIWRKYYVLTSETIYHSLIIILQAAIDKSLGSFFYNQTVMTIFELVFWLVAELKARAAIGSFKKIYDDSTYNVPSMYTISSCIINLQSRRLLLINPNQSIKKDLQNSFCCFKNLV